MNWRRSSAWGNIPVPVPVCALVAIAKRNPEAVSKGCYFRIERLPIETPGAYKLLDENQPGRLTPGAK
jgi:hypothetical protein